MTDPNVFYAVTYLGETIDEANTRNGADVLKQRLVNDIMADRLPNFLTSDDFEDRDDCANQIRVERRYDDPEEGE